MTELRVAVCDDLEAERVQLGRMIRTYAQQRGFSIHPRLFVSGEELLDAVRRPDSYHVLFLDIFMAGLSGVETALRLRAAGCRGAIVFARTMDWCLEHLPDSLRVLPVYAEGERQELPLSSISYVEVLGHQCHIHTSRQTVVVRRGLDDLEAAIGSRDFLRCHRSFLVNLNFVQDITGSDFRLSDGTLVPISSGNLSKIRNLFSDWTYMKAWEQP